MLPNVGTYQGRMYRDRAFTLVECLLCLLVIAILFAVCWPGCAQAVRRAREVVTQQDRAIEEEEREACAAPDDGVAITPVSADNRSGSETFRLPKERSTPDLPPYTHPLVSVALFVVRMLWAVRAGRSLLQASAYVAGKAGGRVKRSQKPNGSEAIFSIHAEGGVKLSVNRAPRSSSAPPRYAVCVVGLIVTALSLVNMVSACLLPVSMSTAMSVFWVLSVVFDVAFGMLFVLAA